MPIGFGLNDSMRKTLSSNFLGPVSTFSGFLSQPLLLVPDPEFRNSTSLYHESRKVCFSPTQKLISFANTSSKRELGSCKKMDENSYTDLFGTDENLDIRRSSTAEDVQVALALLKEIDEYKKKNVSSWIIESKVKKLCGFYNCLLKGHKNEFIQVLAKDYSVNHKQIFESARTLCEFSALSEAVVKTDGRIVKNEEKLRNLLTPQYYWLFLLIGKLEKGVKFLVDLRTDILDLIAEKNAEGESTVEIQQLNYTLKELLSLWFSIGFLHLQRVTWSSSCEMLQKISEYEAVHPVRSWTDLKRRVGLYRRCFVFLHASMPNEPIVVLHTALCDEIASSMKGIVSARSRMSVDHSAGKETLLEPQEEDPRCVKAAVFYSISSTQKGLQGIELGNYLIKSVVHELQNEFPQMTQFSSLSPIPNFKSWLLERLKSAEKGPNDALLPEELINLKSHVNSPDTWRELRRLLHSNAWIDDKELVSLLEKPLMRLCARYLFVEKRRGYAFDSVANFHLKNGAVMWRLNWLADLSPRGLGNSCSIMVNYRYFLDDTETNSRNYLESKVISASESVLKLAEQAQQIMIVSKM